LLVDRLFRPRGQTERVLSALVSRTRAPGAAYQDMFVNNTEASSFGGLAVAIPGDVRGYYEAWSKFGRLPWSELFQPAILRCEHGFIVEEDLSGAIKQYEDVMYSDPNFRELFVKEDGTLVQEGDLLKNPKLGATLRAIAEDPFTFYNGTLAADIVQDLSEYGSIITLNDLNQFVSKIKTPLNATLDNGRYKLFNPPPPSSGSVLDFIVNILDGYNFSPASIADTDSKIQTYHRIVEAFKFAYAKRSELGDEDFVDVTELVRNLTSDEYAEEIRRQIDDNMTHDVDYYGPTFDIKPDSGTAHMNILAPDGSALAMTGTINLFFGAKVRGSRTGIIFNDDMDDFSTPGTYNYYGVPASPSNYIEPGKIPMSSMSPTIVLNEQGEVVFMSGAAGGTRITTETSFLTVNSLWFDKDLSNATDTARVHHQLVPNELVHEPWLEQAVLDGLRAKNHVTVTSSGIAVVGSVRNRCLPAKTGKADGACIEAVSDARKGGAPAGY
jgi:gamma-glutamyltranspeptidase / glutathione hydrolase / leukotriene-C4 hydrolase